MTGEEVRQVVGAGQWQREVERRFVANEIRMVGKVQYDETRVKDITAWVPGRLDRLYVKLFVDEEDLCLNLLLDASASMSFGEPSKLDYGARLAAALGFVGLVNLERVGVGVVRERIAEGWSPTRGRGSCWARSWPIPMFQRIGGTATWKASPRRFSTWSSAATKYSK